MDPGHDPLPFPAPPPDHDWPRYSFRGYLTEGAVCRLRIWRHAPPRPVVLCTELPDNDNTSITNICEFLAAEVVIDHFPWYVGKDDGIVWVEHYPPRGRLPEEFSRVAFADWQPAPALEGGVRRHRLGTPSWRRLEPAEVAALVVGEG